MNQTEDLCIAMSTAEDLIQECTQEANQAQCAAFVQEVMLAADMIAEFCPDSIDQITEDLFTCAIDSIGNQIAFELCVEQIAQTYVGKC